MHPLIACVARFSAELFDAHGILLVPITCDEKVIPKQASRISVKTLLKFYFLSRFKVPTKNMGHPPTRTHTTHTLTH